MEETIVGSIVKLDKEVAQLTEEMVAVMEAIVALGNRVEAIELDLKSAGELLTPIVESLKLQIAAKKKVLEMLEK